MAKATTVRFTDEVYQRLDQASARTGMPVNSIVVAACLEWMQRHTPEQGWQPAGPIGMALAAAPRWSTIRRAMRQAGRAPRMYPFERQEGHRDGVQDLQRDGAPARRHGPHPAGAKRGRRRHRGSRSQ